MSISENKTYFLEGRDASDAMDQLQSLRDALCTSVLLDLEDILIEMDQIKYDLIPNELYKEQVEMIFKTIKLKVEQSIKTLL